MVIDIFTLLLLSLKSRFFFSQYHHHQNHTHLKAKTKQSKKPISFFDACEAETPMKQCSVEPLDMWELMALMSCC
jgi:hypothetical protein